MCRFTPVTWMRWKPPARVDGNTLMDTAPPDASSRILIFEPRLPTKCLTSSDGIWMSSRLTALWLEPATWFTVKPLISGSSRPISRKTSRMTSSPCCTLPVIDTMPIGSRGPDSTRMMAPERSMMDRMVSPPLPTSILMYASGICTYFFPAGAAAPPCAGDDDGSAMSRSHSGNASAADADVAPPPPAAEAEAEEGGGAVEGKEGVAQDMSGAWGLSENTPRPLPPAL
mmetsp:Transcript_158274/g.507662  ORF Transcript_158274/g.507662 Transcript_158274/m.507662 type:complete len:228 (-) Transcript_158274:283-966(-)